MRIHGIRNDGIRADKPAYLRIIVPGAVVVETCVIVSLTGKEPVCGEIIDFRLTFPAVSVRIVIYAVYLNSFIIGHEGSATEMVLVDVPEGGIFVRGYKTASKVVTGSDIAGGQVLLVVFIDIQDIIAAGYRLSHPGSELRVFTFANNINQCQYLLQFSQ